MNQNVRRGGQPPAPTREIALQRLERGLAATQVAGTVTNLTFLHALTRHAGFAAGDVDTGLIARDLEALTARPDRDHLTLAAEVSALLAAASLPGDALAGFTLWQPMGRIVTLAGPEGEISGRITQPAPDHAQVELGGQVFLAERAGLAKDSASDWSVEGRAPMTVVQDGTRLHVLLPEGRPVLVLDRIDPLDRQTQAGSGGDVTLSPMPGLVKSVLVAAGDSVAAGDALAVLEAMKMEHTLTAARDGVVAEVLATEGTQVEAGAALIRLEALPTDAEG